MATIEQLEVELTSKLSIAEQKLNRFQENLGRIGSIIGKDPTYVYDLLLSKHTEVSTGYASAVNVNTGLLSELIDKENKVLAVLDEVMVVLDRIDSADDIEAIDVKNEVAEGINGIVEGIESRLEENDISIPGVGFIVPGLASYVLLRYVLKAGRTISLVASAAVSLMLKK